MQLGLWTVLQRSWNFVPGKWELHLVGFCVCGRDKSSNYKRVAAEAFKGFLVLRPVA